MAARIGRLRRGCLVSLLVMLIGVAGLAWVVYRALDPASLRSVAETRLSAALGQRVTIGTIGLDWLPTPSVEAREITIAAAEGQAPPSIALSSIRIVPRLSSLFSRPIVAERIELVGVEVHALRDGDGRWRFPSPASPAKGETTGSPSLDVGEVVLREGRLSVSDASRQDQRQPPSIHDLAAVVRRTGKETRLDGLSGTIGQSSFSGSAMLGAEGVRLSLALDRLQTADLPEVFGLAGLQMPPGISIEGDKPLALDVTIDTSGAIAASGEIAAASVGYQGLVLTSLKSPLRLAASQLSLGPVTFAVYGGRQSGRITANLGVEPPAWALDTRIEGVDMRQLVNAATSVPDSLSGVGALRGRLEGVVAAPMLERATGTMAVALSNGAIHNFPLIAAVNSALRIAEGDERDLRFESLTATMAIAGGRATTRDLLVRAGELTVTASGTLGFNRSLDFRGHVVFSAKKAAELVRAVREAARLRNAKGEIDVPVVVTGTVTDPHFGVDTAELLQRGVQDELQRRLEKGLRGIIK